MPLPPRDIYVPLLRFFQSIVEKKSSQIHLSIETTIGRRQLSHRSDIEERDPWLGRDLGNWIEIGILHTAVHNNLSLGEVSAVVRDRVLVTPGGKDSRSHSTYRRLAGACTACFHVLAGYRTAVKLAYHFVNVRPIPLERSSTRDETEAKRETAKHRNAIYMMYISTLLSTTEARTCCCGDGTLPIAATQQSQATPPPDDFGIGTHC